MKVSVIIPSFNEGLTLFEVVKKVLSVRLSDYSKEIIIVDDGSTDRTSKLFKVLTANFSTSFVLSVQPL